MFNLGLAFQSQNDLPKAVHFYQRAIKLKPDFVEVMNALGIVLHTLNRYKEAISIYQQSIEISPKMPDAYNNLGISLLALNRATEAAKAFEKSMSLNPNNPQPYNNLGLTLKRLNKIDKAIDNHFQVVIWPEMVEAKDINDMILDGLTSEDIQDIIESNTFVNLRAKAEFVNWKKI
jgi:tetratricopeptide (TPR) repeat protein